jgi:alkaline phosphatase D
MPTLASPPRASLTPGRAAGRAAAALAAFAALSALPACADSRPPPPSNNVALVSSLEGRTLRRVALGSCAHQQKPQPLWLAMLRDQPDLYLALGDNIYGDTDDVSRLRDKYWRQDAVFEFATLRRTVPIYGTWDDHDYGRNDAGVEYPRKHESQQLFLDFMRVPPDSPRRARRGVYDAVVLGPPGRRAHIVALDLRYYRLLPGRDPAAPEGSMLGQEQWAWLQQELTRPSEVLLLLSSSQLLPDDGFSERWAEVPADHARLLRALGTAKAGTTVVLSGDRHFSEISALDPGPAGRPLFELTSSGITEIQTPSYPNPLRTEGPFVENNYGLVDLEWDAPEPALVLRIRGADGRELAAHRVPMAPLPPPSPAAPSQPSPAVPSQPSPAASTQPSAPAPTQP